MMGKDDRKQEILEAASKLFLEYGYRKTTLDDVASAVRVRKSTLYHYFANKDELFRSVVDSIFDEYRQGFEQLLDNEPLIERAITEFLNLQRAHLERLQPAKTQWLGEYSEFFPVVEDVIRRHLEVLIKILETRLQRAVDEGQLTETPVRKLAFLIALVQYQVMDMVAIHPDFVEEVNPNSVFIAETMLSRYMVR